MTIFNRISSVIIITLLWVITCHAQVPNDNVVAYFPFIGDATDVTGNGNSTTNLTALTLTSDRLGQFGSAYSFNGSSSLIKLPNLLLPSNTAFAISCWVNIAGNHSTSDQGQTIIDLRGQYQIALSYFQSNYAASPNAFQFYLYSSPNSAIITSPNNSAKLNTWQHIVCNYGNNVMELYLDGILIGTQASLPPGTVSGYNNTIGKDYNVSINRGWVNGTIDEVIFYKRKLTSTEITAIYTNQNLRSEIQELYSTNNKITFGYDVAGNRTSRNRTITLKSTKFINEHDSADIAKINYAAKPDSDSLVYSDMNQQVKIYPNPTLGELRTELSGFDPSLQIGIYVFNSAGNLIIKKVPATASEKIDLSAYSKGVYLMRIIVGDNPSEWKIIKE